MVGIVLPQSLVIDLHVYAAVNQVQPHLKLEEETISIEITERLQRLIIPMLWSARFRNVGFPSEFR